MAMIREVREEAIQINEQYVEENSYDTMIERELRVMKMVQERCVQKRRRRMEIRRAEERDIPRLIELLEQVLQIHADIRPEIFIPGTTK